jgi:hypothetical protein
MGNIQIKISDLYPGYENICEFDRGGVPVFIEGDEKLFRLAEPSLGGSVWIRDPSNIEEEIAAGRLAAFGSFEIVDRDPKSFAVTKVRLKAIEIKPPRTA